MYLDHSALQRISHVLEQIDNMALMMDDRGNVIYPEDDQRQLILPEAIRSNPFEPLVYGGVTLIGTKGDRAAGDEETYFLCLSGDSADVRNCAILCGELIGLILRVDVGRMDRAQALQLILRGESDVSEMESMAAAHAIPLEQNRCVVCLHSRTHNCEQIVECLAPLLAEEDCHADVSRHTLALVKALPEDAGFEQLRKMANAMDDAFQDAGMNVLIGVSDPRIRLGNLADAMTEAREAINVGSVYRSTDRVFLYSRMLLERFLDTVPAGAGDVYGAKIFNSQTARLFNEEMVHTIEVFFENNLNLSEAARKLYIHRNTLVYRLEKVQRLTGFDLREFDDAVTFKLMMLLNRNGGSARQRI